MGYKAVNGDALFNDDQKIRISISKIALSVMKEDMEIFSVPKKATFINTVIENYKYDAKASISQYLERRKLELEQVFDTTEIDAEINAHLHIDCSKPLNEIGKKRAISQLLSAEKKLLVEQIKTARKDRTESALYRINNENVEYLKEECKEEIYYPRAGEYLSALIEEYCSLPFIERERIYRKQAFETVELACRESRFLKVKERINGENTILYVYPYKIVPDPNHNQLYLVCYSRKDSEDDSQKIIASFSMYKMNVPKEPLKRTFYLNKDERKDLEKKISEGSVAYLLGNNEQIKVRLTENGKKTYHLKLFNRPAKNENLSTDDVFVFNCTPLQIYNYFFSFGADAEIISPEDLREKFIRIHKASLKNYEGT